ncbi:MAG: LPS-assembly protein LptD, partial [Treponema sp.]|nr:LPS-assembly protein LptD [Treponema sp.]
MRTHNLPRRVKLPLFLLFLAICLSMPSSAQESPEPEVQETESPQIESSQTELQDAEIREMEEEAEGLTEAKIVEMDIRSSTLRELAAWCRSLGLSEWGGREELAWRLRDYYKVAAPARAESPSGRHIIIESARSTEYFTLDVVDEEYARLRGNVIISLKDGDASHRISAQDILYNRTRNQVTARGNVSYVKEEGDTIETFRGDSITVNLDSWATILTGGISERALSGEETTYRFAGTVISRSEEEVTILKDAKITNGASSNSYWSLNATKLWLLPGADFALRNAVLKVGEIPILYLPFFYYPADEVIFHPVLGSRSREGNFIQTTTYLIGRPKPEDLKESSLTKILGSGAGMEKERQGIFLRSTGKKLVNPGDASLKLLFDFYANLGLYFGLDMNTPNLGILKNFDFSAGFGRTRDVMPTTLNGLNSFTPYPNFDGESEWNSSQLFSGNIPLRYRLKTSGSLSGDAGEFSWEIPHYSDPYVDRDFLNRAEAMDWFHIIQEGASFDEVTDETVLSSYEWRLNGRISIRPPQKLAPYLTSLSFSNFSSTLLFNERDSSEYWKLGNTWSPSRKFYIPDKFTMFSVGLNFGGTPITIKAGGINTAQTARAGQEETREAGLEDPFKNIGSPRSPWGTGEDSAGQQTGDPRNLSPPALGQRFDLSRNEGPQFSIDYQVNPAAVSELQFRTGMAYDPLTNATRYRWAEAKDVDWTDVSSVLATVRG